MPGQKGVTRALRGWVSELLQRLGAPYLRHVGIRDGGRKTMERAFEFHQPIVADETVWRRPCFQPQHKLEIRPDPPRPATVGPVFF